MTLSPQQIDKLESFRDSLDNSIYQATSLEDYNFQRGRLSALIAIALDLGYTFKHTTQLVETKTIKRVNEN